LLYPTKKSLLYPKKCVFLVRNHTKCT